MMDSIPKSGHPSQTTLRSILTDGILSASELKKKGYVASTSYDEEPNTEVFLNCIYKIDGIAQSLYNKTTKSSFPVSIEEDVDRDKNGIFAQSFIRNQNEIDNFESTYEVMKDFPLSSLPNDVKKEYSFKKILIKDDTFVQDLSKKTHNTALFIIELSPDEGEKQLGESHSFFETRRKIVLSDKIKKVLVPKRYSDVFDDTFKNDFKDKLYFVDSIDKAMAISCKCKSILENQNFLGLEPEDDGDEDLPKVHLPKYEEIMYKEFNKLGTMYTHITRIEKIV